MSDLIERLRAEAKGMPSTYIKHQAADELEQKDAEIDALVNLIKQQDQQVEQLEGALQQIANAANYTAPEDIEARLANEVQVYAIAKQALGERDADL